MYNYLLGDLLWFVYFLPSVHYVLGRYTTRKELPSPWTAHTKAPGDQSPATRCPHTPHTLISWIDIYSWFEAWFSQSKISCFLLKFAIRGVCHNYNKDVFTSIAMAVNNTWHNCIKTYNHWLAFDKFYNNNNTAFVCVINLAALVIQRCTAIQL